MLLILQRRILVYKGSKDLYSNLFYRRFTVDSALTRTCDKCGKSYYLNSREIPRITISKRIDINDLKSSDFIAYPDYCAFCVNRILDFLQSAKKLSFTVNTQMDKRLAVARNNI